MIYCALLYFESFENGQIRRILGVRTCELFSLFCHYYVRSIYCFDFIVFFVLRHSWSSQVLTPGMILKYGRISRFLRFSRCFFHSRTLNLTILRNPKLASLTFFGGCIDCLSMWWNINWVKKVEEEKHWIKNDTVVLRQCYTQTHTLQFKQTVQV